MVHLLRRKVPYRCLVRHFVFYGQGGPCAGGGPQQPNKEMRCNLWRWMPQLWH